MRSDTTAASTGVPECFRGSRWAVPGEELCVCTLLPSPPCTGTAPCLPGLWLYQQAVWSGLGVHESLPAGLGSLLTRLTLNRALDLQTRRPHLASEELVVAVCPSVLETRAKGWQRSRPRVPGSSGTGWWEPLAEDTAVPLFAEPGGDRAGMHNNGQALTLPLELT